MPRGQTRWRWAVWLAPMLFCLAVHSMALKTWFSGDDFAWLGLPALLRETHDWRDVLFGPRAQGTVRVLSERAYFLIFSWLFGLNAIPFRIWAFLTQFANLTLMGAITRRVTGSVAAGVAGAVLWSACSGLATPMHWSSAYNEICCAFFMLLAFWLLLRFLDTGLERYWKWQWVAYLLGFGALELMVMYPAVAALYTWLFARARFRRTLWLFLPAIAFTVWHVRFVPKAPDPQYAMHFDTDMVGTLLRYWAFATGAWRPEQVDWRPLWLGVAVASAVATGAVFLIIRRGRLAVWCVGWFVLVLLPLLPLSEHFSDYYVTIPAIGLAILGGWAVALYPRAAGALALAYLVVSVSDIRVADRFQYERARKLKRIVAGLDSARSHLAGKKILLAGVTTDLFWSGFFDDPFRLIGIDRVYLTPGSEDAIEKHPEWGRIDRFAIPLEATYAALDKREAVVFEVLGDGTLAEVTSTYKIVAGAAYLAEHRGLVDVGNPLYASRLKEGWYNAENGFRWMGKRAVVEMGGPATPKQRLAISEYSHASALAKGPVTLTVSVNGQPGAREVV